jgi:hypothetical protein
MQSQVESNKSRPRSKVSGPKLNGRSRVTNGSSLLPSVDGRSIWARRLRDLISLFENDYGGAAAISEAERCLIRRASALIVECELMEVRFAVNGGAQIDELDKFGRATNTLRRVLESLGLQRRSRDVTPNLHDYLDRKANEVEV